VAVGAGTLIWGLTQRAQQLNSMTEYDAQQGRSASGPPPREDAVLVFGSTGKLGRQVVLQVILVLGNSVKNARCELALPTCGASGRHRCRKVFHA
jgi:hypothetical protein